MHFNYQILMDQQQTIISGSENEAKDRTDNKSENLIENMRYKSRLNLQKLILTKLMQKDIETVTDCIEQTKGAQDKSVLI